MKTWNLEKWLLWGSGLYLLLLSIAISLDFIYLALLPLAALIIWAAFFKLEFIFYLIVFFTPLSINLEKLSIGGLGIALPTEPLLVGLMIVFIFKVLSGKSIDRSIYKHPISIFLYVYLTWILITAITSESPSVSFKFLLSRLWFISVMFFIASQIFQNPDNIKRYFILYIIPLAAVVIYTVIRHSQFGFDKESAHWVMEPIFKDHTSYGAVLAMYLPASLGLLFIKRISFTWKMILLGLFIVLCVGLVLSYTRAAWVSLVGALAVLLVLQTRIRFVPLLMTVLVVGAFVSLNWTSISMALEKNEAQSSDKLDEHVSSISNVSSDASNLERLNRWNCAIEMFKKKPILGWGPGTYQFYYAPFQRSSDLTIISTKEGDGGNAHSEYLGPLCEQGVIGMALMIILLLMVTNLGFKLYYSSLSFELKTYATVAFLGLMTYFIHGVLNNYLDLDKASIPFWGFIAILVALDLSLSKKAAR